VAVLIPTLAMLGLYRVACSVVAVRGRIEPMTVCSVTSARLLSTLVDESAVV
jgi:hypothetical protein